MVTNYTPLYKYALSTSKIPSIKDLSMCEGYVSLYRYRVVTKSYSSPPITISEYGFIKGIKYINM